MNRARQTQVTIDGITLDSMGEDEIVAFVMRELGQQRGGRIITPNVDILRQLRLLPGLRHLMEDALAVADGMPLIWASKLQGTPLPGRVAGSSLLWSLSAAAASHDRSVYLLGGTHEACAATEDALMRAFPRIKIAGRDSPPVGFERHPEMLRAIEEKVVMAKPDIVFVAMGFPKQDLLAAQLAERTPATWYLGCGAAFSFAGRSLERAPLWVQNIGLEWLHRLSREPQRLARRYLVHGVPYAMAMLFRSGLFAIRKKLGHG